MKPWLRLESCTHADPRVRKAGAGAVWPWVLCRLKDGDGFAESHDLDPWAAADACGIPEELAAVQLAGLRTVGLLIETPDGWTTPAWDKHQADPTNSDRQKRFRERNIRARQKAETPPEDGGQRWDTVTVTNGYVTSRNGSNARRDGTGQDGICIEGELQKESSSRGPDTVRARGQEHTSDDNGDQDARDRAMLRAHKERQAQARPATAPDSRTLDDAGREAMLAWVRTHADAKPLSSAVTDTMRRTVLEQGADRVRRGVDAWVKTANGHNFAPVAFVEKVCARLAKDEADLAAMAEQRERDDAQRIDELARAREHKARMDAETDEQREARAERARAALAEMDRFLAEAEKGTR